MSKKESKRLLALAIASAVVGTGIMTSESHAATRNWLASPASNNWNNAGDWDTLPVTGDTLNFAASSQLTLTNDFTSGMSFGGITFAATAGAYTFNGNDIALTGNITNSSTNLQTINLNIATTAVRTVTMTAGGGNVTLGGIVSGAAGGITTAGTGTLTLSGANTYTGATTVSANTTLLLANTLAAQNSTITVNSTNGLTFAPSASAYTVGGLSGSSNFALIATDNSAITLQVGNNNTVQTYSGIMSGSGGLTKIGTSTLALGGANSYTGVTAIKNGTLQVNVNAPSGAAGALGNATSDVLLGDTSGSNNATLATSSSSAIAVGRNVTVQSGNSGTATILNNTGTSNEVATFTGNITLGSSGIGHGVTLTTANVAGATATFSGIIQDPAGLSGAAGLVTIGTGASSTSLINLTNSNTYTGGTSLVQGNLFVGSVTSLGSGTLTIGGTGTASLGVYSAGSLSINNDVVVGANLGGPNNGGNITFGGNVSLTGNRTITLQNSTMTFGVLGMGNGVISDAGNNFGLTLAGATVVGSFTLNAPNTFGGGVTLAGTGTGIRLNIGNLGSSSTASAIGTGGLTIGTSGSVTAISLDNTSGAAGTLQTNNAQTWNADFSFVGTNNLNMGSGAVFLGTLAGTTRTVTVTAKTFEVDGVISNGTTVNGLTKAGAGTMVLGGANTYTGTTTINGGILNLNNASALGGGGNIAFTGGTLQYSANNTADYSARIVGSTSAISIDTNNQTVTFASTAATPNNTGGLTKAGLGTLNLSASGLYTGATTISNGTLNLTVASAINGSAIAINGGATLTESAANAITGASSLALNGSTVILSQPNNFTGAVTITNLSNALTLADPGAMASSSGIPTFNTNGTLNLRSNATNTFTIAAINTSAGTPTINVDDLDGTTTGKTLTISGALTPRTSGGLNVTGGHGYSLGLSSVTLNNTSGQTSTLTPISANITVGTITNIGSSAPASIALGGYTTGNAVTGVISNGSGTSTMAVTSSGMGVWTLSGANTYTGATTISSGAINIAGNSALGTGGTTMTSGVAVTSGGALQISNNISTTTAVPLTLNGTGLQINPNNGALENVSGTNTYSGLITLGATGTSIGSDAGTLNLTNVGTITGATFGLTLTGAGNGSIASIIGTTTGTLTKTGSGTWALSGANTYTGATTISGGTLQLNASTATSTVLPSTNTLTLGGGALAVQGTLGSAGTVTQTLATLTLSGQTSSGITLTDAGSTTGTNLTFTGAFTTPSVTSGTTLYLNLANAGSGALTLSGATASTFAPWVVVTDSTGTSFGTTNASKQLIRNTTTTALDNSSNASATNFSTNPNTDTGAGQYSGGTLTIASGAHAVNTLFVNADTTGVLDLNGQTLNVASNALGMAGSSNYTIQNGALTSSGGELTLTQVGSGTLTITGAINPSTSNSFNKGGNGTLIIGSAQTYTGTTYVAGGTLKLSGSGSLSSSSTLTTSDAASFDLNGISQTLGTVNNTSTSANGITNSSVTAATLTMGNSSSGSAGSNVTGNLNVIWNQAGTSSTNSGSWLNTGNITLNANGSGTITLTGLINNAGTITNSGSGSGMVTLGSKTSGSIGSAVTGIIQNSANSALRVQSFDNTAFTGNITILKGNFIADGGTPSQVNSNQIGLGTVLLGDTTPGNSNNAGFLLGNNATGATITNPLTVQAGSSGILSLFFGGTNNSSGGATFSGPITLANDLTIQGGTGGTFTVNGGITGTGNISLAGVGLTLSGSVNHTGTITNANTASSTVTLSANIGGNVTGITQNSTTSSLTISGASPSYTSGITITTGTVKAGASANLGSGVTSISSSGIFDISGVSPTMGLLSSASSTASVINSSGTAGTLTLNGTGTQTFAGVISGSTMGLTVAGGTQILTGANTYTGATTVSGGVLQLGTATTLQNEVITVSTPNGLAFGNGIGTFTIGGLAGAATQALTDLSGNPITLQVGGGNVSGGIYSGVLTGAGNLVKIGTGTQTISGLANLYTGTTTVLNGTLAWTNTVSTNMTLGAATSDVVVGDTSGVNTAILSDTSAGGTLSRNITIQSGSAGGAAIGDLATPNNNNFSYTGNITLNRNVWLGNSKSGSGAGGFTGAITDAAGTSNTVSLIATNGTTAGVVNENITGANTWGGGTIVDGGLWTVAATSSLGAGNVTINTGELRFSAVTNLAAGKTVLVNNGGLLSVTGVFDPTTQIDAASSGALGIETGSYNIPLNMANIGTGSMFLGGSSNGTAYTATSLGVGSGNTYRLGAGGGTGSTSSFTINSASNVLTGSAAVVVGSTLANSPFSKGNGWVLLSSANNYTGGTTVDLNSGLEGTAQGTGTATASPFGSLTANITLHGGTLQLDQSTGQNVTGIGAVTFDGSSTLAVSTTSAYATGLQAASLTRSNNGVLVISGVKGKLGSAASSSTSTQSENIMVTATGGNNPTVTNSIVQPYYVDSNGNFLTYGANGFAPFAATVLPTTATTATTNYTVTAATAIGQNDSVNSLEVGAFAVTGAFTLSIGNTTNNLGGLSFNGTGSIGTTTLAFGASEGLIFAASGKTGTISSLITGTNGLTKSGPGNISLSGTANTFSGQVTINQGQLIVAGDGSLGNSANNLLINGGALTINANGATISSSRTITIGGNGGWIQSAFNNSNQLQSNTIAAKITGTAPFLVFNTTGSNNNSYLFNLTNTGNDFIAPIFIDQIYTANPVTLSISADSNLGNAANSITISSGATLQETGNNVTSNRAMNLTNMGGTIDVTGTNTYTIGGVIAGDGNLTKISSGTLELTAANNLTGSTVVSAGTLLLGNANALQNSTVGVGASSNLNFDPSIGTFKVGGLGGSGNVALTDTGSTPITLQVGNNNANINYSGVLSGGGSLTKIGTGTQILAGANTYNGTTTISSGVLQLNNTNALQNSAVTVTAANGLQFNAGLGSATVAGLNGAGNFALQDNATTPAAVALSVVGGGSYSGVMSGLGGLSKSSSSTLTLTGANTYSGATSITGGTLQISGSGSINNTSGITINGGTLQYSSSTGLTQPVSFSGTGGKLVLDGTSSYAGAINVTSGNTLGGHGTYSDTVTIASGGTLSPGNSPGQLTVGTLVLDAGSTSHMEIGGATIGTQYDNVTITSAGGLTYGGTLELVSYAPYTINAQNGSYTLFSFTGGYSGELSNVTVDGFALTNSSGVWTGTQGGANYSFTDSTGVFAVTIPEPGTISLAIAVASMGLMARRRRVVTR